MPRTVDYFLAPQSPWTYLGHERFVRMAREAGAAVRVRPIDLGRIFPISGGLPLARRAPQRQAYRLVELRRFSEHLGLPLNLHPKFFPVSGDAAARLIVAVDQQDGSDAALRIAGAVLAAVWVQERDIASDTVLAELLRECGLAAARLPQSKEPGVQQQYEAHTQAAIDANVFGSPSYVIDGELFWGQDRLDFVQRRLSSDH
ncbi:2-hydroxychromene-2-carboxylate isomerase [Ramlibacter sp. MMS24-I3-19]|uniref:2-hydroxychromene-2-carboxylate isomerase n=1 Tax=Ramlibacter sp. MMS24-I3-19 TaxID=3416606 RepID=UPI003CFFCFF5